MDETEIKHVVEAALLAAGRPLSIERLQELFVTKGGGPDRATLKRVIDELGNDYEKRGIEVKEVANGYRIQIRRSMIDWLAPLWEERAPRYTRALLETLALIAYRQPITRAEIEEVRGVVVSTNIVRTLLERGWVRVVGHRDVPGKPAMFGTTKEFLDYFGLKKLDELPALADIKDGLPELSPQTDLIESLEAQVRVNEGVEPVPPDSLTEARMIDLDPTAGPAAEESSPASEEAKGDESVIDFAGAPLEPDDGDETAIEPEQEAEIIPLRARVSEGGD
jgi:segregation and condensation protein B